MNIPEKLAEAVARQDWQLVSDVHESLTGQSLNLPDEDRKIGAEIIEGLEGLLETLKRGEMPKGTVVHRETAVEEEPKKKKKKKTKKKSPQNVLTLHEDSPENIEGVYEPDRTGHSEARHAGTVKVDPSKLQLIVTPVVEGELEKRIQEAGAVEGTGPLKRAAYQEIKYMCKLCSREQKSIRRLSAEEVKNFICDGCGKRG